MIEVSSVKELIALGIERIALACGNFDGLHRGHEKIISTLLEQAKIHNSLPVVLTFEPHPKEVLTGKNVYCLTSISAKKRILSKLGVEALVCINFTKEFANKTAEEFVTDVLCYPEMNLTDICIGSEWRFGKGRKGAKEICVEGMQLRPQFDGFGQGWCARQEQQALAAGKER